MHSNYATSVSRLLVTICLGYLVSCSGKGNPATNPTPQPGPGPLRATSSEEVEPNDDRTQATPIDINSTEALTGEVHSTPALDHDWFSFEAEIGDVLVFDASTVGEEELPPEEPRTKIQCRLWLYEPSQGGLNGLCTSPAGFVGASTCHVSYQLEYDATYYLEVWATDVHDETDNLYTVSYSSGTSVDPEGDETYLTAKPLTLEYGNQTDPDHFVQSAYTEASSGDADWYGFGYIPGDNVTVKFRTTGENIITPMYLHRYTEAEGLVQVCADGSGPMNFTITAPGSYYLLVGGHDTRSDVGRGGYNLHYELSSGDLSEDDDTLATATPVLMSTVEQVRAQNFQDDGSDVLQFEATAGTTYTFWTEGATLDTAGTIYDPTEEPRASDDNSGEGENFLLEYTADTTGLHYLEVTGPSGGDDAYELHLVGELSGPTNVSATDGTVSDHVHITWDEAGGADSYKVYRSTSENGSYSLLGTTTETSLDHYTGVTTTFWYKVKSSDSNGDSVFSAADSGYVGLAAPSNVQASDGTHNDHTHLSWDAVAGASVYRVFRSTSSGGPYTQIAYLDTAPVTYDDYVTSSDVFYYRLKTQDSGEQSWMSPPEAGNAGLGAPANVSATDGTYPDKVRITWDAVSGATSYKVYRATSPTPSSWYFVGNATGTTFDNFLNNTTVYYFIVRAFNAGGESWYGPANAGNAGLAAPLNVLATDGTITDRVRISWSAAGGAASYNVYRRNGSTWTLIGNATGTSYDDLQPTTTVYTYHVRSMNAGGDLSNPSATNTGCAGLAMPTNFAATDGTYTSYVRLSWNAVYGVTDYRLYRSTSPDGTYALIGVTTATSLNFTESTSSVYYYRIRARNANGYSVTSPAEAGNAGLNAPTNVAAGDGSFDDKIQVTWTAASDVGYYQVYRATSANGSYTLRGTTTSTTFNDTVADTNTYYYKVRSGVTNVGYSAFAGPDSGYKGS